MKTLFLARHAKSNWNQQGYSDFDRPLNEMGKSAAPLMALRLQQNYTLDKIISSDAVRALATAAEYEKTLTQSVLTTEHALYNASFSDIVDVIKNISNEHSKVMLVGHNPGMTEVVDYFIKDDFYDMPAGGVAIIQFDLASWLDLQKSSAQLLAFEYPKNNV